VGVKRPKQGMPCEVVKVGLDKETCQEETKLIVSNKEQYCSNRDHELTMLKDEVVACYTSEMTSKEVNTYAKDSGELPHLDEASDARKNGGQRLEQVDTCEVVDSRQDGYVPTKETKTAEGINSLHTAEAREFTSMDKKSEVELHLVDDEAIHQVAISATASSTPQINADLWSYWRSKWTSKLKQFFSDWVKTQQLTVHVERECKMKRQKRRCMRRQEKEMWHSGSGDASAKIGQGDPRIDVELNSTDNSEAEPHNKLTKHQPGAKNEKERRRCHRRRDKASEHQNAHKRTKESPQRVENISTVQVIDLQQKWGAWNAPPQKMDGKENTILDVEYIRQIKRTRTMRPRRVHGLRKFAERRVNLVMTQTAKKDSRKRQCHCRNLSDETRTVNRQSKEITSEVTLTLSQSLAIMPIEGERVAATTRLVVPNAKAEVENLWKGRQHSVVAMNTSFKYEMVNLPSMHKKDNKSLKGGEDGQVPVNTPQIKIANTCSLEQAAEMVAILPSSPEKRPQR
jgi:hypothetical protein